jgi:hypothetical protein
MIGQIADPTTWLIVTGWNARARERRFVTRAAMSRDPWTDPDPQPGDFDAELDLLADGAFEFHEGDTSASFGLMVVVEGEDAHRLARIADARGQKPSETLAELLREADRPAT